MLPIGILSGPFNYDSFGVPINYPLGFRFQYAGREYDFDTELYYYRARWYDPQARRFISEDPIGLNGGINLYAYVGNNPMNFRDPTGLWFGFDDLAFGGGGALLGVGWRLFGDIASGEWSDWEDYVGAAIGGAVAGETLLYTANPFLAGAAGGFFGNFATQITKRASGKQCSFDVTSLALDTGLGTLTGFIPGRPLVSGVNAGRGSNLQVFRQIRTKARSGTIKSITPGTAMKMADGAFYEYAAPVGAGASAIGSRIYWNLIK